MIRFHAGLYYLSKPITLVEFLHVPAADDPTNQKYPQKVLPDSPRA